MILPAPATEPRWKRLAALALVAAASLQHLALLGMNRYLSCVKSLYSSDLPFSSNILFNTDFWGHWLYSDNDMLLRGSPTFLSEHFSPTLLLLAPFYRFFGSPLFLVHFQTLAPLAAGFFLLLTAEKLGFSSLESAAFFFAWLGSRLLYFATMDFEYGFHMDCMIPPLFFAAWLAWLNRSRLFYPSLILLLGCKENLPLSAAFLAACLMAFPRLSPGFPARRVLLLSMAMVAAALATGWLFGSGNRHLAGAKSGLGVPWDFHALWGTWKSLAFTPYFYFSFWSLALLPELAANLRNGEFTKWWHAYPILCIAMAAALSGALALKIRFPKFAALVMLLPWAWGAWSLGEEMASARASQAHLAAVDARVNLVEMGELLARVPPEASLAAPTDMMTWAADRHHLLWTYQADGAEYLLHNGSRADFLMPVWDQPYSKMLTDLIRQGRARLVWKSPSGLLLFRRH